mgnify:CR=1 FL=1
MSEDKIMIGIFAFMIGTQVVSLYKSLVRPRVKKSSTNCKCKQPENVKINSKYKK